MLGILDIQYSSIAPTIPKYNALVVFNMQGAKLALQYSAIDFVIVLNEQTGRFARCNNLRECEQFLTANDIN